VDWSRARRLQSAERCFRRLFAGEVDPVGVVDHPVEDRIGECRMPIISCQRSTGIWLVIRRAGVVAVLDDFEQISRLIGVERFGPQSSRMSSFAREIVRRSLA